MFSGVSNITNTVDSIFLVFLIISVALLGLITFLMVFFVIKYHHKRHATPENIEGNTLLEIVWTVIPVILVTGMFYYGWVGYRVMRDVPEDAMVVKVTGSMWQWNFEYANGKQSDVLKVPLGKPVKLELSSLDVIHSFYVPAYRIKEDVVPGLDNYVWFQSKETGSYDILCAEYCGLQHAYMLSKVIVMPESEFNVWYASEPAPAEATSEAATTEPVQESSPQSAPSTRGAQLVRERGCVLCHALGDASAQPPSSLQSIGPSLKGLFGKKVRVISDREEREIVVDEAYLRRSILNPTADIVKGFRPLMPAQQGLLTEDEIAAIIDYLKTL